MTGGRERDGDRRVDEMFLGSTEQVPRVRASDCSLLKGRPGKEGGPASSCSQAHPILRLFSVETRDASAVAVSLAEPSAESQGLAPHVGGLSPAHRGCFPLSPLTQAGEMAQFRHDALPESWCNPGKEKNLFKIQNQDLTIQNHRDSGQDPGLVEGMLNLYILNISSHFILCCLWLFYLHLGFQRMFCSEQQLDKKHKTLSKHQIQFPLSRQKKQETFLFVWIWDFK